MQKQERKFRPHSKMKKKRRKRQLQLAMCAVVFVVLLFLLGFGLTYHYVNRFDKAKIHNNIFIGNVEVSDMTAEEAVEALNTELGVYGALPVTLVVGEASAETNLQTLGLTLSNMEKVVEDAVSYGKEGTVWKRFGQIRDLKKEPQIFEMVFEVNAEMTTAFVEEYVQPLETRAQDAKIERANGTFVITDEVIGTMVDTESSIGALNNYLNESWEYTTFSFEMQQIPEEPAIHRADLEPIQDELGSFYTDAGSGDRKKNIIRATEMLNGIVLMPGEELSVVAATTPYTLDNGYVEGTAYENGKIIKSIGGGLCQVSTTFYNAVLYAELGIMTRSAHSMMVDYVEPSRDAAIAEGVKDLIVKNTYDTPILIEGYIDGSNNLRFYIYGKETRPDNRTVEYISETLETKEYSQKFVASSDLELGKKETEGSKINGCKARLWKVVYEDGAEVDRKVMNNSNYSASEVTITIGVASDCPEAVSLLKTAIATQDEAKINEAIKEAKTLESEYAQGDSSESTS